MRTRLLGLAAGLTAAILLGACGDGGSDPDVATLGGDTEAAADDGNDDGGGGRSGPDAAQRAEFEDALLEFTECMREHGIDMPDPQFDGEGGGGIAIAGGPGGERGIDPESEEFQAAQDACAPILEEARQGIEIDPEQQAEMQDRMLEFAQCMRDHGIDMPDPQFDGEGGVTLGVRPGSEDTGSPSGPDPDDPEFQEAVEECSPEGEGGPAFRFGSADEEDDE